MRCAFASVVALGMATSNCVYAPSRIEPPVVSPIVSAEPPPPSKETELPTPRAQWLYQPGYWMRRLDRWVWEGGRWFQPRPGYRWSPIHWEAQPDGTWKLVPGEWVVVAPG